MFEDTGGQGRSHNAYWIARIAVTDPERYGAYARALPEVVERFGGRFLVAGGRMDAVEGDAKARNVVIAFEDYNTARLFRPVTLDEFRVRLAENARSSEDGS